MSTFTDNRPWEELERLVTDEIDGEVLEAFLETLSDAESVRAVSRLGTEERAQLLSVLDSEDAADLVDQLPESQAVEAIEDLTPEEAARIVEELPSNEAADLLSLLDEELADAILGLMDPAIARVVGILADYDSDVAGGIMVAERLAYRASLPVSHIVEDLRHNADLYHEYDLHHIYVTTRWGRLLGVLRMRDLLLAPDDALLRTIMVRDPESVPPTATLDELRRLFEVQPYYAVPVVSPKGRILGVVRRGEVEEAVAERSERDFQRSQGVVSGEELRSMPMLLRSRRRLGWLSINIVLNVMAATIIAMYEDTLSSVIALAVFLPIISDMSGCSGNQAVAVTMRELSLGVVLPTELRRVLFKEACVGIINGLVLGALIAVVAFAWKGNGWLGLVVGSALTVNTIIAVSLGGTLPLMLRRFGVDPALASGPILTTLTDMLGFLLVLGMASRLLPQLLGT